MAKLHTLHQNTEFRTLYYRGKSQVHPALVTYCRRTRRGVARIGITTSKKLGSAVVRNRCRRIIREAFRQLCPRVQGGWDICFVARARTCSLKSTDIVRVMERQLKQAGVIAT